MTSVVLCDSSKSGLAKLRKSLNGNGLKVTAVTSLDAVEAAVERARAQVVVVGAEVEPEDAVRLVERLAVERPATGVILMAAVVSRKLLSSALRAGARDVLADDSEPALLDEAIDRAARYSEAIDRVLVPAEVPPQEAAAQAARPKRARMATMFSTKGGVGKTVMATNVAVALAQRIQGRVILVDLDLQFGDAAVMLQMIPRHTLGDVVQVADRLDADLMKGFLTSHTSGIKALLAPLQPQVAETVTQAHVARILDTLRTMCDFLIVDTPASFGDHVLSALDVTDDIYLIATMDVPSLKNVKLSMQTMRLLQYPEERVKLVLNRADSKVGLHIKDVERAVDMRVTATVPSDRVVPRAVNRGVPVVLDAPRSGVARSLTYLAEVVEHTVPRELPVEQLTSQVEGVTADVLA